MKSKLQEIDLVVKNVMEQTTKPLEGPIERRQLLSLLAMVKKTVEDHSAEKGRLGKRERRLKKLYFDLQDFLEIDTSKDSYSTQAERSSLVALLEGNFVPINKSASIVSGYRER